MRLRAATTLALATVLLLAGCATTPSPAVTSTSATPGTSLGGTTPMTDPTSVDTTSPIETITGLPESPDEINRIMYGRLVEQWKPLLDAFGEQPVYATYAISHAGTGYDASRAHIGVDFGQLPEARWKELDDKMARIVREQGWQPIGVLDFLNVRKDGYYLHGGCAITACSWQIDSSLIARTGIGGGQWQGKDVVELLPGGTTTPGATSP